MSHLKISRILPFQIRKMLPGFACPSRQTFLISGFSKRRNLPLKIATMLQNRHQINWISDAFFAEGTKITDIGDQHIEDYLLSPKEADMLIVKNDAHLRDYYKHLPQLESSCWVNLGIELKNISELGRLSPRGLGKAEKNVLKHKLSYAITNNEEDFRSSVIDVIYPYLKWRHKDACLFNRQTIFDHLPTREVLHIIANDQRIACCAFTRDDETKTIHLNKLGVRIINGECPDRQLEAIPAIYYYAAKHFYEDGYTYINLGGSRPLVQDPITSFKLKMGATIPETSRIFPHSSFCLFMKNNSEGLRDSLTGLDLITKTKSGVELTCFCDNTREASSQFQAHQRRHINKHNSEIIRLYNVDGPSEHSQDFRDLLVNP